MANKTSWTTLGPSSALACALAGCTAEHGGASSGPDQPAEPAYAVIDGAGGTLRLGAATLDVPPGALDGPVAIFMRSEPAVDTDEYHFLSPLFDLQPEGLTFAEPVTLTIARPDDESVESDRVYVSGWTPESIEPLATREVPDGFATDLSHFSWYSLVFYSGCSPSCADFYGCCPDDDNNLACVPIDDNLHCGSCSPCVAPDICCDDVTPAGRTFKCLNVKTNDNDNCGACGVKCSENTQGRNNCCEGLCVDFQTDERNCGSCGKVCPSGQECEAGVCTMTCTPCVGYDGVEDCCPPGSVCHMEPIKGGPCI